MMSESVQLSEATAVENHPVSKGFRWTHAAITAVAIGILALLGWGLLNNSTPQPEVGQPTPDFNLQFFSGYEWNNQPSANLSDMKGNIVVINFWASWCVECRYEAAALENAAQKYANDGVVVLGVAFADVEPKSLEYMQEFAVSYPHAPDLGTDISDMYRITGVPETFVVDAEGNIAYFQIGPISETTLNGVIDQLLQGG